MISASPFSTTGEHTSLPYLTYVTTEPPRWLIPCTSLTLTSKPCERSTFPIILDASSEPCPPTPTIIIDLVFIIYTSKYMLSLVAYRTQLTHFLAYAAAYALCMVDNALAVMDRYSRTALSLFTLSGGLCFTYLRSADGRLEIITLGSSLASSSLITASVSAM